MAKTNTGYKVNHVEGEIVITKAFKNKASVQRTPEYKTLLSLKKENPSYSIVCRTATVSSGKVTHKGLTYKRMEDYINMQPNNVVYIAQYKAAKEYYDSKSRYAKVKKWFLETFKNYSDDYVSLAVEDSDSKAEIDVTDDDNVAEFNQAI